MRKTLLRSIVALLILSAFSVTSFLLGAHWAALASTNGQLMMNVHVAELLRQNEPALALTELEHLSSINVLTLQDYASFPGFLKLSQSVISMLFSRNLSIGDYRARAASYLADYPDASYQPTVATYLHEHYSQPPQQ